MVLRKKFFAIGLSIVLVLTIIFTVRNATTYFSPVELDPVASVRETDLAILGLVSTLRAEGRDRICWLGAVGSSAPRRVVAAVASPWDRFWLARSFVITDERSSVAIVDSCMKVGDVILVRFPLPDLNGLPREYGAKLTAVVSEVVSGTGAVGESFERASVAFSYPDGTSFQVFTRKRR